MIYWNLFLAFAKVGLLGFGGGLAIVRLIYDSVQPFLDMSPEAFANIVAIAQITPGPVSLNTATYVGYQSAGLAGAAVASFGTILPAFIITSIVARAMNKFRDSKIVNGAIQGIRPITIGLVGAAVVTLAAPSIAGEGRLGMGLAKVLGASADSGLIGHLANSPVDIISVIILITTVVLVTKYKKSPFLVLILMGCLGAVLGV